MPTNENPIHGFVGTPKGRGKVVFCGGGQHDLVQVGDKLFMLRKDQIKEEVTNNG